MFSSVGDVTDRIIKIENENDLFNLEINEVYVWEIIRPKIYAQLIMLNEPQRKSEPLPFFKKLTKRLSKLKSAFARYASAALHHPYWDSKRTDVIVFESSRKLKLNNEYIDPYTKFVCDDLRSHGLSVSLYQSSYSFDRLARRPFSVKHLDLVYLRSSLKTSKKQFGSVDLEKIKRIEKAVAEAFNVKFDLEKMISKEIALFKNNAAFFDKLFKKKKPKEIYLVNFCDKPALIAMAKKNNIRVTDVQHGLISSKDIIYHYPTIKEESLHYFPDRFYAWSDVWSKVCRIPLKKENIISYGNKYLDARKQSFSKVEKKLGTVLVISQPGLTSQIASVVLQNMNSFKDQKMLYKLHPSEYGIANLYAEIGTLKQQAVSFVEPHEDLYRLMAETETVLGVYSTALLEALDFGCKVVVLDLPGAEMMEPFMEESSLIYASDFFETEKMKMH